MDPNRKQWNAGQQALRKALARAETHAQAVQQFLIQHAMCHAAEMSGAGLLLMPPTRHAVLHLNEAARIKQKCAGSDKKRRW